MSDKQVEKFTQGKLPSSVILGQNDSYTAQVQSAEAVFGGRNINEKLKIAIPGLAKAGEGIFRHRPGRPYRRWGDSPAHPGEGGLLHHPGGGRRGPG